MDELGDLDDEPAVATLAHHVGQLGDDDRLLALLDRLDVRAGADAHPPATARVRLADPAQPEDGSRRREVRALHVLHQALDVDVRVLDVGDRRGDDLAEVVRRDVRRHADGDARGAVDEQVREARRQDERLVAARVVGRREVDRVRVEVAEHLGREAVEAGLGVAHRRGAVAVDVPEVPLPVDERIAHREVLGEADERVVDRGVAVRVVLAHHLADDLGALHVPAVRLEAELAHDVEDAPVDGLQPVAHVGQRPPDDDRHRVVEIRGAHLVLEVAQLEVAAGDLVDAAAHRLRLTRPGWRRGGRCPR